MTCRFERVSAFPRGTLFAMLSDAYSCDPRFAESWSGDWKAFDDFFFDDPRIADRCGFVTVAEGEPVGFVSWDPRRRPESEEIGYNCIRSEFKGRGYGTLQIQEAVRRICPDRPRRIVVTTSALLVPAQRMYERAGCRETGRRECAHFSGELIDYEYLLTR